MKGTIYLAVTPQILQQQHLSMERVYASPAHGGVRDRHGNQLMSGVDIPSLRGRLLLNRRASCKKKGASRRLGFSNNS